MTDASRTLSVIEGRDRHGRFTPGPNNKGRPVGARAKASRATLEQIKAMGGDAIAALREALTKGERWAVELVISKIVPANRTIEFEDFTPADIIEALRNGDLDAAEGKDLSAALRNLREIEDLEQIRAKLIELEAIVGDGVAR
jgi:hypothetical protein